MEVQLNIELYRSTYSLFSISAINVINIPYDFLNNLPFL